ncbi:EamA family transporter [Bacillus canaveralius]|uniref:EamA family transporter n=1 Tax=Bacillus canaveralius TaxID=1403243 RepID=A0A2N5GFF6_9BACI|nr:MULTISPECIES: DMT family transporter [Bacillus]PLR79482.1 EamA family transporter [Bacillus canaveralius]PLR83195.1 EamA family transporter [Bacillus sp. V33-4]PLR88306.1 EamA family transporter [Bacillus canaveralius]RSK43232.1 DMT family transporter [Bacillus canaveralius]
MNEPRINPYLALAIGVISVSTSAILVKVSSAPAGVIAFYRLLFSVLLMLPFFLLRYVSELRLIRKTDWLFSMIAGVILAFHFILWFESLNYTSVASSTVLVTLQPLFAFVGTYLFFKEALTAKAIMSGIVAIVGSIIISWGDLRISGIALFGDLLALAACALITAYLLFGQTVRKRLSLMTYTFVVYSISALTLFVYVMVRNEPLIPTASRDWIYFLLLAVVPTLLGHTLFNWSLKWLSTSTISMAILFEPVGAAVLAYYLLGEQVIMTQIVGGMIVIMGISMFLMDERRIKMKKLKEKSAPS